MASHVIGPFLIADEPLAADAISTLDAASTWTAALLERPGGYAIGPFLVADAPLPDDAIETLYDTDVWAWGIVAVQPPFTGPRRVVPVRPSRIANRQAQPVTLHRERDAYVLLPRRGTVVPAGSFATGLDDFMLVPDSYGYGAYGSGVYGDE